MFRYSEPLQNCRGVELSAHNVALASLCQCEHFCNWGLVTIPSASRRMRASKLAKVSFWTLLAARLLTSWTIAICVFGHFMRVAGFVPQNYFCKIIWKAPSWLRHCCAPHLLPPRTLEPCSRLRLESLYVSRSHFVGCTRKAVWRVSRDTTSRTFRTNPSVPV